jgi:hypothetical protein
MPRGGAVEQLLDDGDVPEVSVLGYLVFDHHAISLHPEPAA